MRLTTYVAKEKWRRQPCHRKKEDQQGAKQDGGSVIHTLTNDSKTAS